MPERAPTSIDISLGWRHRAPFLFLMALLLAVAGAMVATWIGNDDQPAGLLLGAAAFVVVTGLLGWIMVASVRPRTLTVDATGIHLADRGPRPFSAAGTS